jgi:hypothetical protein
LQQIASSVDGAAHVEMTKTRKSALFSSLFFSYNSNITNSQLPSSYDFDARVEAI